VDTEGNAQGITARMCKGLWECVFDGVEEMQDWIESSIKKE
jgi:hypothetical protein